MNKKAVIDQLIKEKGTVDEAWKELLDMELILLTEYGDNKFENAMFKMTGIPNLRIKLYVIELVVIWIEKVGLDVNLEQANSDAGEIISEYGRFNTKIEKFVDAWLKAKYTGEVD